MNRDFNPYQAPQSQDYRPQSNTECWREGKRVFLPDGADLPCRCIRCGTEADPPRRPRKLYWHHPALALLILTTFLRLPGLLIYLIVAVIVRKKIEVTAARCPAHRKQMHQIYIGLFILLLVTLFLPYFASTENGIVDTDLMSLWYGGLVLIWLVLAIIGSIFRLRAVRINNEYSILKGFGQGFLDTLPEEYEAKRRWN
ncbi:hypothetical protein H9Q10_08795 [Eikenella sp. S3360]|uniref:Uncharacterized protein n=1 Tax=Eikenella glucosivorans TaxID=2766967 RepID=A0ABS0NBV3_9NEIS|nr:hypothetical protein [Eikenella glucosivorans]MBH5329764.1 hypothetical protein [Eikenella glucosivorans]